LTPEAQGARAAADDELLCDERSTNDDETD
jgi:hypothetical protein